MTVVLGMHARVVALLIALLQRAESLRPFFAKRNAGLQMVTTRSDVKRSFDTVVKVSARSMRTYIHIALHFAQVNTSFKSRCLAKHAIPNPSSASLSHYMRLPVEQYVCIKLPLDANLQRLDNDLFELVVPPVRFFHLQVSPSVYCNVTQNNTAVIIESTQCILNGSPYVKGLNGCFKFFIRTVFSWEDASEAHIHSCTSLHVEVDPPFPFNTMPNRLLESTGALAMRTAIRTIEREFVKSLTSDFLRWASDEAYRAERAKNSDTCVT